MTDNDQPAAGAASIQGQSGGVLLDALQISIGGDVVGRDKIIQNITYEAPTPIATALRQLPPPPRDFTGRAAELTELMAQAETDGVTIAGLQGMGGVGKTALALALAERLKPHYPDAQFFLDLKGADQQPLSVAAALTHVIRAYYPTAKLPDGEAELRGLYLSILNGRRALLLLDNAADKAQVEPLIPPASCCLLITSRQHFALPGLCSKDLNTLPPDDARALLLKIAPRIGKQADSVAKLCGYLPLALRLAGSALAERRTLTPGEYVKRLEDTQTRLGLVEASLNLSYALLSEELQEAWCALAVFPDTFHPVATATVWAIEKDLAQDRLDELMRYSLVDWNESTKRARLHDLARLFANKHLSAAARLDSQRRHAGYYQKISAGADWLYRQGREQLMQGLTLFDLEWTNIQAGHAWAVQYADMDPEALSLCDDYVAKCYEIVFLRQHPRERINWLETALSAARKLVRKESEGWHLGNLGYAYDDVGEYRRAIEYYEQDLAIAREIGDRRGEGQDLGNLGVAHYSLGEYRLAIQYYEQSLSIKREVDDWKGASKTLGNLGFVYSRLGEYRRAIEYHEQNLAIAREIGYRHGEGRALGSLGGVYYELGKYRQAIEYREQDLTIARELGDRRSEAKSLFLLSLCFNATDDRPQAIAYAQAALNIFTAIESPHAKTVRDLLAKWRA